MKLLFKICSREISLTKIPWFLVKRKPEQKARKQKNKQKDAKRFFNIDSKR